MTPEEKKQKSIEWGIEHPEARNELRRKQRNKAKQSEKEWDDAIP